MLAKPVATFLAVVVVIIFLDKSVSNVLLNIILKIHMHKNGTAVSTAFLDIGKLRTFFIYMGSSIRTIYQPQLEQVWATKMAKKAGEVKIAFHGMFCFFF